MHYLLLSYNLTIPDEWLKFIIPCITYIGGILTLLIVQKYNLLGLGKLQKESKEDKLTMENIDLKIKIGLKDTAEDLGLATKKDVEQIIDDKFDQLIKALKRIPVLGGYLTNV